MSEVTQPPRAPAEATRASAPRPRRPFQGLGGALAKGLGIAASTLTQHTARFFGEAHKRSGAAYADFSARPEHARWRAYALGSYGLIVLGTLMGQLYSKNSLGAYVRVQPVDLPNATVLFVRNDSKKEWKHLKLTLNGIYGYETNQLGPGAHVLLPVNRFAIYDPQGKPVFAPKNIPLKQLEIDCDRGSYDLELGQ